MINGIAFSFVTENIASVANWYVEAAEHTLIVHRAGNLKSLDIEFEHGPSARIFPRVGDIWAIPAGLHCAARLLGQTVSYCEIRLPRRLLADRDIAPVIGRSDPFLNHLVDCLESLAGLEDDLAQMTRDSLAEAFRLHACRAYGLPSMMRKNWRDRPLTVEERRRLLDYMQDRLETHRTLSEMATLVSLPVAEFLKAFKDAFHQTPHQFLIQLRIAKAKDLLLNSRVSITEIALATGFATSSHFATSFRQHVGVSPSDFRLR